MSRLGEQEGQISLGTMASVFITQSKSFDCKRNLISKVLISRILMDRRRFP